MATKVIMPQLGESVVEGTVTKWLRQVGEKIEEYESLLEVNTDKVDTEIPSPAGGTILKILVPEGETVNAGTVLAWIGKPGESIDGEPGMGEAEAQREGVSQEAEPALAETQPVSGPVERGSERAQPGVGRSPDLGFISPVVARLAQEHNVDLNRVKGTGSGGRITKKDVLDYLETDKTAQEAPAQPPRRRVEEAPAWETPGEGDLFRPTEMVFPTTLDQPHKAQPQEMPAPAETPKATPTPAPAGPDRPAREGARAEDSQSGRVIPLDPVRRSIAEHMVRSKRTSPHVTTVMEADLSRVVAHLEANKPDFSRSGTRLTYTAYFTAAAVAALKAYPLVNSSWTEEGIRLHPEVNIGMATSLDEQGLIVPVIKGADGLSLLGLARAIGDLAERARSRHLQPEEVRGGTFTITNHGITGSLFASPIINQPQCAILGVGAIQKRVVVINDAIAIRPMVYLTLTFDHRILDGASGDQFLMKVVKTLEGWG